MIILSRVLPKFHPRVSMSSLPSILLFLLLSTFTPVPGSSEVVLDDGYAVSTIIDFNKKVPLLPNAPIHPSSLLPMSRSLDRAILLDFSSSVFYSLPIPISQESEISLFAGKGVEGFSDGDPMVAMFDRPKSFAIDLKDNVYVADRSNRAIRKISSSGVTTTIAGGYSEKSGHIDGPAQNASFSPDFDVVFVPKLCALLISDRGNRLIRQIDLKPEDCMHESRSGLGVTSVSIISVLCLLFGSALGFVARPFVTSHEVSIPHWFSKTWRHCQAKMKRILLTTCFGTRSAVASSPPLMLMVKLIVLSLHHLSIIFRYCRLEKPVPRREPVSLIDSDVTCSSHMTKSQIFADQLKDLISFDGKLSASELTRSFSEHEDDVMEDASTIALSKIDYMITANLSDFGGLSKEQGQMEESTLKGSGLVKRRPFDINQDMYFTALKQIIFHVSLCGSPEELRTPTPILRRAPYSPQKYQPGLPLQNCTTSTCSHLEAQSLEMVVTKIPNKLPRARLPALHPLLLTHSDDPLYVPNTYSRMPKLLSHPQSKTILVYPCCLDWEPPSPFATMCSTKEGWIMDGIEKTN